MLCVLQAINGLVGWYEESNASDAIKALRKNLAPEFNVKRGGRCSGDWEEHCKIISTIANTNDVGHFETIIYSLTLFLVAVSLMLVRFIMAVLLYNIYGVLKTLGFCVVLLVASIPIAMQVVCTSTMALSCFGRETRPPQPTRRRLVSSQTETSSTLAPNASVARKCCSSQVSPVQKPAESASFLSRRSVMLTSARVCTPISCRQAARPFSKEPVSACCRTNGVGLVYDEVHVAAPADLKYSVWIGGSTCPPSALSSGFHSCRQRDCVSPLHPDTVVFCAPA